MAGSMRAWAVEQLKPLLPTQWKLVPVSTNLDELSPRTPVVMLQLESVEPLIEAPLTKHRTSWTLTIIQPGQDAQRSQEALDDNIIDLLHAIDEVPDILWRDAKRATFQNNWAFDITVEAITQADPKE